ncbi:hypothetical protein [Lentzea sp. NPDC059081]|uniref:hypothetical protein n=1 Tax=Lentzea sp. NPDC059081 TaxID=3346719 RepID=UPI0036CA82DE
MTPVDGAHDLVTTLEATLGVLTVTRGTFGRVVGYTREGEQRLDVHLLSPESTTFSLAHNDVRVNSAASVAFGEERVLVRTDLVVAERRGTGVRVSVPGSQAGAVHDLATGEVSATTASGHGVTSVVDASATSLSVDNDVTVRVAGDDVVQALMAGGRTMLELGAGTGRAELTCAEGFATILTSDGAVAITCTRSGRRVEVDRDAVTIGFVDGSGGLRWDRAESTLSGSGDAPFRGLSTYWSDHGLEIDLGGGFTVVAADRIWIRWYGRIFSVGDGEVVVAEEEEDWYLGADGHLGTSGCMVAAERTIDGAAEVFVRPVEHDWSASVWSGGTFLDDGAGLRTVLDERGAVFTPAARADSSVVSLRRAGQVVVNAAAAQVEIAQGGEVVLRSGPAELRVIPGSDGRELKSTITCGDLFSVVVTDSERTGLDWRTTHQSSSVSHLVRGTGELVVSNSPSGSGITATVDEVRVVPSGSGTGFVITV